MKRCALSTLLLAGMFAFTGTVSAKTTTLRDVRHVSRTWDGADVMDATAGTAMPVAPQALEQDEEEAGELGWQMLGRMLHSVSKQWRTGMWSDFLVRHLALIILLKLAILFGIWYAFFSHPAAPTLTPAAVQDVLLGAAAADSRTLK